MSDSTAAEVDVAGNENPFQEPPVLIPLGFFHSKDTLPTSGPKSDHCILGELYSLAGTCLSLPAGQSSINSFTLQKQKKLPNAYVKH